MISTTPVMTDAGISLHMRAMMGTTINFTRFAIGDGKILSEGDIEDMVDLVNPMLYFGITEIEKEGNQVILTGTFSSTDIEEEFVWRELGVYCQPEDGEEVLYAYANDGDKAGTITKIGSSVSSEQTVKMVIICSNAENVTATISGSAYASWKALNDHKESNNNPHGVTAEQIGADAAGAAAAVEGKLNTHSGDTTKHITQAERSTWNSKADGNHSHTASEVGAAPDGYGLGTFAIEIQDANTATASGWYKLTNVNENEAHVPRNYVAIHVTAYDDNFIVQDLFMEPGLAMRNSHLRRVKLYNTWGEWEWVNPEMEPGVEYRTTERWNGKIVYRKLVMKTISETIGNTTSVTDVMFAHDITNMNNCISCTACSGEHIFPNISTNYGGTAVNKVGSKQITLRINKDTFESGSVFYFDLRYTKTE